MHLQLTDYRLNFGCDYRISFFFSIFKIPN